MFGKDDRETDVGAPAGRGEAGGGGRQERRVAAWIGASIVINGNLTSSEDMTLAGQVDGDVAVPGHTLDIAPGASIRGDVQARSVVVRGEVRGTINASERVEIGDTGSVAGDIHAPRMVIAEGAALHGKVGIAASSS